LIPATGSSGGSQETDTPSAGGSLSRRLIEKKIAELAEYKKCPEEGSFHKMSMWYVNQTVRDKYSAKDLGLPNVWQYILPVKDGRCNEELPADAAAKTPNEGNTQTAAKIATKAVSLITKFTKVLTEDERKALQQKKLKESSTNKAEVPSTNDDDCNIISDYMDADFQVIHDTEKSTKITTKESEELLQKKNNENLKNISNKSDNKKKSGDSTKKRVSLTSVKNVSSPSSIMNFLKKSRPDKKSQMPSPSEKSKKSPVKDEDCITLD